MVELYYNLKIERKKYNEIKSLKRMTFTYFNS